MFLCGRQGDKKTTRINLLLEKFVKWLPDIQKGKGRGPNFKWKVNADTHERYRVDVCQKYCIKVDGNVKTVRFMSAGDSEETVQDNIKVARDEGADILITATHEEKWIHADGSSDVKRRFTCSADTDDGQAEEMLGQLKQLVCLDAIVS